MNFSFASKGEPSFRWTSLRLNLSKSWLKIETLKAYFNLEI